MSGDATLRDKVLEAIGDGKIPSSSPVRTWAGPSCGACCVICGQLVVIGELEFELEFATSNDGNRPVTHHAHRGCFFAWNSERRELELAAAIVEIRLAADEREGPT